MAINLWICIPWRSAPDRLQAYERTVAWWRDFGIWLDEHEPYLIANYRIFMADSDPERHWNLAQARNRAFGKAMHNGAGRGGSLIFADADTIPESPTQIATAIKLARAETETTVVYPFQEYVYLPADVDGELSEATPIRIQLHSVGGIIVTDVDSYLGLCGFDEHFTQWGFEDTAFFYAARTLGIVMRTPGKVFHIKHSVAENHDCSEHNPGYWRNELYKFADGRPQLMRALIK
jgi:hypothetical protein